MELVEVLWLRLRELNFNYSGISVALLAESVNFKKIFDISSFFGCYRLKSASKYFVDAVLDSKGN
jgi:hypothetical protein